MVKVQPPADKVVGPCDLEVKSTETNGNEAAELSSSSLLPSSTEGGNGRVVENHKTSEMSKKSKCYRKRRGTKILSASSSADEEGSSNRKRSKPKLRSRWSLKVQNIRKHAEAARKNLDNVKNVDAPKVFNYQGRLFSEGEFKKLPPTERFVVDYIKQAYFYDGKLAFVTFWKYYPENHKGRSSQEWGTNLRNYRNGVEAVEEFFKVSRSCKKHFKTHWETLKENDFKIFGRRPIVGKQPPGPKTVQAVINLEESEEENNTSNSNNIGTSTETINVETNIAGANKIFVSGLTGEATSDQKPTIVKREIKQENCRDDCKVKMSPAPMEIDDDYCEIVEVKMPQRKRTRSKSQRSNPAQGNRDCKRYVTQSSSRGLPVICNAFLTSPMSFFGVGYMLQFAQSVASSIGNPNNFNNYNNKNCNCNLQERQREGHF